MCGIVGIIKLKDYPGDVSQGVLENMSNAMRHRGPDGSGVWVQKDRRAGLAHRRLSIVDLSPAGAQPMSTPQKDVWVTFNGEIYNFKHLRKNLEAKGYNFFSSSDTEVLLYVYQEYGDEFYLYLDGDFGIGLWDERRQKLLLVRDRAGVKPIYYSLVDGAFIFASEIKALLQYPGTPRNICHKALYHYLTFLVAPPPNTLIEGIKKLPVASVLVLEPQKYTAPQVKKYWEPVPNVNYDTSFNQLDNELEEIFNNSVRKRLMSDVPVGVLFSGGVDSTLNLTSFANLIKPEKVKTFTVGMDNAVGFNDESKIARKVAEQNVTEHHEIRINDNDVLNAAAKLAHYQDEPISDPVAIPLYFVTKLAKEQGVTVLQAGEGADELFCGYSNYRRFLLQHEKWWVPLSKLPISFSQFGTYCLSLSSNPKARKIRDVLNRKARGQEFFMSSAIAYYELEKKHVISKEFAQELNNVDSFDIVAPYYERLKSLCPEASLLQKITFIELQLRLPELLLMRADKMSMANSIEIRVPFLDRELMDFAMRVPDSYKLRDGISKEPIKRLAAKFTAYEDIYRPKTGFGVPIQQWFKGPLGQSLLDAMEDDNSVISSILNINVLKRHLHRGLRTVNEAFQLWVIYNLLTWHKTLNRRQLIG